ncbi:polysaccharide biosynthesis protein [Ostertagia ostertagi]
MDRDVKHLQAMLLRAQGHRGSSFLEIYQNCNIFNDGAFEIFTEKASKPDEALFLEQGQPLIYGADKNKGIRLDGYKPQLVRLDEGYSADDLWVHDETDFFKAQILTRFFDNPVSEGHLPRPFGVFYVADRLCYEDQMQLQLEEALATKGRGDLDKLLQGQTIWYGLSTIMARLIGFLLNPLITYLLNSPAGTIQFGEYSTVMAYIPFLNVLFTYGMETAYFRFSNSGTDKGRLFRTSFSSIILSTIILSILLFLAKEPIARLTGLEKHPEYITWTLWVIALDTLSVIPFAKLRQEGRPRKYAFVKVAGVVVNILLVILLVGVAPRYAAGSDGFFARWYHQYTTTGFLIMAFIAQSAVTLLLLAKEWMGFRFKLDLKLWRTILKYSLPFVIIGLGGMVNEVIDRIMLLHLYKGTEDAAKAAAFKMAAEPFFFSQAADKNAPKTYAKVMKWFVITLCLAFLFTALFLDVWKYLNGSQYRSGLGVVPILLFANISLGIYYNLAVWYKITAQLKYGIYITLAERKELKGFPVIGKYL